jgi:hypothetical protein
MPVQSDSGQSVGSEWGGREWSEPDPWTSALWARPDTVGGYAPPTDVPPPAPPAPPDPPNRLPRRGLIVVAALVVAALLAGGAALAGTLRSRDDTTAAPPRPSATSAPTRSVSPTAPTPTAPPSTGQTTPPGVVPGAPPSTTQQPGTQQPGTLTPQQAAAAAAVSKSLVDINTTVGYSGSRGAGPGIVLSADGLVLTNHHVVAGATAISVTDVGNGQTYGATGWASTARTTWRCCGSRTPRGSQPRRWAPRR